MKISPLNTCNQSVSGKQYGAKAANNSPAFKAAVNLTKTVTVHDMVPGFKFVNLVAETANFKQNPFLRVYEVLSKAEYLNPENPVTIENQTSAKVMVKWAGKISPDGSVIPSKSPDQPPSIISIQYGFKFDETTGEINMLAPV